MGDAIFVLDKLRYLLFVGVFFLFYLNYQKQDKVEDEIIRKRQKEDIEKLLKSEEKGMSEEKLKGLKELDENYVETMLVHHRERLERIIDDVTSRNWFEYFCYATTCLMIFMVGWSLYNGDYIDFGLMLGLLGANIYFSVSYKESKFDLKISLVLSVLQFQNQFPDRLQKYDRIQELHRRVEPVKKEIIEKLEIKQASS